MNWLDKLRELIFGAAEGAAEIAAEVVTGGKAKDRDGYYFYVKCAKCGAAVRIRADKRHDFQQDYELGGYFLRKEIMDGTCFSLMYANLRLDSAYQTVEQSIEGGELITEKEYLALTHPKPSKSEVDASEKDTP